MKQLFKFLFFRPRDLVLVSKAFILLALVRFGLWLLPFSVLQKLLATFSRGFPQLFREQISNKGTNQVTNQSLSQNQLSFAVSHKTTVNQIIWAVNVSSRYMPGKVKCLARALTTEFLMNLWGYAPELRIGVAKGKAGKLEAHAWVESQGKVLIGQLEDLERFQVLPLPSSKLMVKS